MPTPTSINDTAAIEAELYRLHDEYWNEKSPDEHRRHLGVSIIGEPCHRKLYNTFRWVKLSQAEPRMKQLWNVGHREEDVFADELTWMGFFIRTIDPDTNKQYRFSKHDNHYGGSSDSLALLPWFRGHEDPKILVEYKTHNNKSFNHLKDNKLKKSKPMHFDQMCCYGREFNAQYGLYCARNKDNSETYYEFFKLDRNRAIELENTARDIVYAKFPPPKISNNPSAWDCTYCHFKGNCFNNEPVEKNCRSCKFSEPVAKSQWKCNRWNNVIPFEFIAKGCEYHSSVLSI